jgi:gamma-glutamylcyclotransferase (GGCT)/AIG2-like uncharacterized protein YtfP
MKGFREDWQRKLGAEFAGRGTIRANLYDLGDYPGARVVGAEPGRRVSGELYRLRDAKLALKNLDKYEEFFPLQPNKSLFVRELVAVTLEDGRKKRAWAYLYNRGTADAKLIPTGRYRDSANARHSSVVKQGRMAMRPYVGGHTR